MQDITKPWPQEWKGSFDIVHQRQGMAVSPQQKEIVHKLAELVKPGEWIQFVGVINYGSIEKVNGPATSTFQQLIRGVVTHLGCDVKVTDKISEWPEGFGFVNVQSRDIFLECGASNSDLELAKR
ncbi:hypothetical protein BS50DRAFT_665814 [Corynespora cassiicola Philippines]|uniref:Uncharacterized protein n=1 Tax=Corynespora cassiicola Philippines TaxID=1448308 RepID=A0A2T2NRY0_CORCC|nr:hypothetical protein BS50DRAFT_665814 [Corynespora cassiicola Philippines]